MVRETVDGRAVYLRKTGSGYAVVWGRTEIAHRRTLAEALREILDLFGVSA